MIPFLDLKKLNKPYQDNFKSYFSRFLDSGWFVLGEEVENFENEYAAYCGTTHCIGTANGLDALRIIFEGYKILGKIKAGDHVLVASNTYIATILAIKQAGLIPILVEASLETFNFDLEDLKRKITSQTKVILPTHLYGLLADMDRVSDFAKANQLLIVSDCAQSHGARDKHGNRSGSLAHAAAHSFYPTKNLGALGDGGAVTTSDEQLAKIISQYRNYGFRKRYVAQYAGVNSRLDELQAGFLRIKLKDLDALNQKRKAIAMRYFSEIDNEHIILSKYNEKEDHVFHLFVVRCKHRDLLQEYLSKRKITTIIHYPVPPHKQEALSELNGLSFPVCEQIHDEVLSISTDPNLTQAEVSTIINALKEFTC
ncbi:DegT/DnrJ/EryC1/StrS family aminotransferase [Dokdonia sp. Hel_I_53]|uniref:DegT/DnrJ/EryC1/StrS family aminotransferase n=1 Tax=Dokdonia sp. Hel_I_53 TaxID=1566287 RepID=UPI00119BBF68|nr:DegT/DnrJ/EryC1/StrS family aminotransferase [Dokdonia sp. Hel_I_53]TVZ53430.1 dTDP-4-amino-4,6-dideoxygalactose transaminase [Dokdonia sp. Hel_I_53]